MEEKNNNIESSMAKEPVNPSVRHFSSQEEAEQFNMIENLKKTDMEKFKLFCRMIRIGRMLASAKIQSK